MYIFLLPRYMCEVYTTLLLSLSNSTADRCNIWGNCAFNDKSMKFCTQLGNVIRKIFGYRDIADWSRKKMAPIFQNGRQRFLNQ